MERSRTLDKDGLLPKRKETINEKIDGRKLGDREKKLSSFTEYPSILGYCFQIHENSKDYFLFS